MAQNNSNNKVVQVATLVGDLETEIFYGLNLRLTLHDHASDEDLKVLRRLVDKAKDTRLNIMNRLDRKG